MRSLFMAVTVCAAIALTLVPNPHTASASTNCASWATTLGKQGKVRDSLTMHYLGCDDGPYATRYYYPLPGYCNALARTVVRSAPAYYVRRPHTVAALVVAQGPTCRAYEDGSYPTP